MKRYDLAVEPRLSGRSASRSSRINHKIPAVIYGSTKNAHVLVDENTLVKFNTRTHENALYTVKSSDARLNNVVVLLKDVQIHPVTRRPIHADLFALDLKKTVRLFVEIRYEGKPAGLAEGGLLNIVNRQIEIECLPTEIPESLALDISNLGVGAAKHVSDLKLPEGLKLISSPEMTLAVCNLFVEEVIAPTAAVPAADAAPAASAEAVSKETGKDSKSPTPTPAKK